MRHESAERSLRVVFLGVVAKPSTRLGGDEAQLRSGTEFQADMSPRAAPTKRAAEAALSA
jgi:hypothetical protein